MNSDFPFLHRSNEPERNDGEHAENDNITPEQFLQDAVVGAYDMFLKSKGMDPNKYTLRFEIEDMESTKGRHQPVITQENLHSLVSEFITSLVKLHDESTSLIALKPTLSLVIKATNMPEVTKDLALARLQDIAEIESGLINHLVTLIMMAKEMNALINTSSMIENVRNKNNSRTKDNNNLLGNA